MITSRLPRFAQSRGRSKCDTMDTMALPGCRKRREREKEKEIKKRVYFLLSASTLCVCVCQARTRGGKEGRGGKPIGMAFPSSFSRLLGKQKNDNGDM